jgi:DSF synthase
MKLTNPIGLSELKRIVDLWADAALQLTDGDLKVMNRLTRAQERVGLQIGAERAA